MRSPEGWSEPGQKPGFDEYTVVLTGMVRVDHVNGHVDVYAGQAIIVEAGEWIRYSTPESRWSRVHRGLHAGVFHRHRAPRPKLTRSARIRSGT